MILNIAKDHYENNKELLRERAKNKYRELCEEEKKYKQRVWKKKDIITCLKKRKKDFRLEHSLHNDKMHFKIAIAKIFFVCSFINF